MNELPFHNNMLRLKITGFKVINVRKNDFI